MSGQPFDPRLAYGKGHGCDIDNTGTIYMGQSSGPVRGAEGGGDGLGELERDLIGHFAGPCRIRLPAARRVLRYTALDRPAYTSGIARHGLDWQRHSCVARGRNVAT